MNQLYHELITAITASMLTTSYHSGFTCAAAVFLSVFEMIGSRLSSILSISQPSALPIIAIVAEIQCDRRYLLLDTLFELFENDFLLESSSLQSFKWRKIVDSSNSILLTFEHARVMAIMRRSSTNPG